MAHKKGSKCGCKHGGKKKQWLNYAPEEKQLLKESLKFIPLHTLTHTLLRYVKDRSSLVVNVRRKDILEERDKFKKMV